MSTILAAMVATMVCHTDAPEVLNKFDQLLQKETTGSFQPGQPRPSDTFKTGPDALAHCSQIDQSNATNIQNIGPVESYPNLMRIRYNQKSWTTGYKITVESIAVRSQFASIDQVKKHNERYTESQWRHYTAFDRSIGSEHPAWVDDVPTNPNESTYDGSYRPSYQYYPSGNPYRYDGAPRYR